VDFGHRQPVCSLKRKALLWVARIALRSVYEKPVRSAEEKTI